MDNKTLQTKFYGVNQKYQETIPLMDFLHEQVSKGINQNHLMLLEHAPVITYTRQHALKNFSSSLAEIAQDNIDVCEAQRGGDVTFHGPGQIVGYPIINLKSIGAQKFDAQKIIRSLEQALLSSCHELGMKNACLLNGFSGVWVKQKDERKTRLRKIIAIGISIKDGATKHGFAFNIDIPYQKYTRHIIPCGLKDKGVISYEEIFTNQEEVAPSKNHILETLAKNIACAFSLKLEKTN